MLPSSYGACCTCLACALLIVAGTTGATRLQSGAALQLPEQVNSVASTEVLSLQSVQRFRVLLEDDNPDESVPDTRTIVPNPSRYPYSAVGRLVVTDSQGGSGLCTGTLVAADIVLTAAHCIIGDRKEPQTYKSAQFIPAYDPNSDPSAPFGTAKVTNVHVSSKYMQCLAAKQCNDLAVADFALLKVDKQFEDTIGFGSAAGKGGQMINTAGYPSDKCGDDNDFDTCPMYHDSGCTDDMIKPSDVYGHLPCLEVSGQSGAPIWLYSKAANSRTIVGVDSFGGPETGEDFTLLTLDVVKELMDAAAAF